MKTEKNNFEYVFPDEIYYFVGVKQDYAHMQIVSLDIKKGLLHYKVGYINSDHTLRTPFDSIDQDKLTFRESYNVRWFNTSYVEHNFEAP